LPQKRNNRMITLKEITKILKEQRDLKANFTHFCAGSLYYNVIFGEDKYQFYVPTNPEEVGTTDFNAEMRAAPLLRYIRKCMDSGELIKLN
jgi:hypothetical protein